MPPGRTRIAWLALALCWGVLSSGAPLAAASFPEFVDPNPAPGNQFGALVVPLASGNVVITSPGNDLGATDAGAIYLFNGATGALISTLRASTANDLAGASVIALTNGNFVVCCPNWDNAGLANVGAVTWGNGTTGVSGVIGAFNSLVGSAASDKVGLDGVKALANGNYVVASPAWKNGAVSAAGAVTWCNGATGRVGAVGAANSVVGATLGDQLGSGGVTALSTGNYVIASPLWNNGAAVDAGAATWCNGETGRVGGLSAANSLVGSTSNNLVGGGGVTPLSNGNYVVVSPDWEAGATTDLGAVTWGNGTMGIVGSVGLVNSLFGQAASDRVGSGGVTPLPNGNYVVVSPLSNRISSVDVGAVTWGNGTAGVIGQTDVGNSLMGQVNGDQVGSQGVTALSNGNYVVASPLWKNGIADNAGAVTWLNGATGTTGLVTAANSLVGTTAEDNVGSGGVTALTNGNYVVSSPDWDNGGLADAGAVTWKDGTAGVTGTVSAANSLVGSSPGDQVGLHRVTALANGNYVVASGIWDNGGIGDAGAVTWGSGTTGRTGAVSAANSLVGSTAADRVGFSGVTALTNGNFVVPCRFWNSPTALDAGAVTWGSGTTGVTGVITAANSLVGSTVNDEVGTDAVTALADGNYVVPSATWNNGSTVDAGAVTWGNGATGITGEITRDNSIVSWAATTGLQLPVRDPVNGTFISSFLTEGGGRVRVGPVTPLVIASALDVPGDQGGWLRLTFGRSYLDHVYASPPVTSYGVWRHVPGTFASGLLVGAAGALPIEADATFPPGTWELVQSVPAIQQDQYVVAVPTISNAAANDYLVTAHTVTPSIWFISPSASGQSLDNTPPAQPTNFTAAYSGGQTHLQWAANIEADLSSYSLYRGVSADFVPAIGNRIASLDATNYADVGPAGGYYKLSAVDVNGNESSHALITPQNTLDAPGADTHVAFALEGVQPNPAGRRSLRVVFALPLTAPARLELLDMSGRRVLARDVGALGAGRHTVNLAEGRVLPAGIYWVSLRQGPNRRTARVAVIE